MQMRWMSIQRRRVQGGGQRAQRMGRQQSSNHRSGCDLQRRGPGPWQRHNVTADQAQQLDTGRVLTHLGSGSGRSALCGSVCLRSRGHSQHAQVQALCKGSSAQAQHGGRAQGWAEGRLQPGRGSGGGGAGGGASRPELLHDDRRPTELRKGARAAREHLRALAGGGGVRAEWQRGTCGGPTLRPLAAQYIAGCRHDRHEHTASPARSHTCRQRAGSGSVCTAAAVRLLTALAKRCTQRQTTAGPQFATCMWPAACDVAAHPPAERV